MSKSGKSTPTTPSCVIDTAVLNENTVDKMDDLGLSIFAKLCGLNRGAFVLDPPDSNTYGCTSFPESFSTDVGIDSNETIVDSAHLLPAYVKGDITAEQIVSIVDKYVSTVYDTSEGNKDNAYGCDVGGLGTLINCPSASTPKSLRPDGDIVKSVTLAGAFVPADWVTGGKVLSMEQVLEFYNSKEFKAMAKLGVNTVQIPVPCNAFAGEGDVADTVTVLLETLGKAGLSAILVLVEMSDADTLTAETINAHITAAAKFASDSSDVIAIQLPSSLPSLLSAVRSASTTLPVLVPVEKAKLNSLSFPPDNNLFAAMDVAAVSSVADVASSTSFDDRLKMFYHENLVCIDRSPIEYLDCYHDMPVYITSGFDLSIDNCLVKDSEDFKDYGQCGRFDETLGSGWWARHRQSLASRQLFTYSKGLGWSFSGWKLFGDDNPGVIDSPAKLMCLSDLAAAGLVPELSSIDTPTLNEACLNGPKNDFAMGDKTLSPTASPPPDCGYGWWNFTTEQCDYWVPPAPTPNPTDAPTMPCPTVNARSNKELGTAAVAGAVVALVLNWLAKKMMGRNEGYQSLP